MPLTPAFTVAQSNFDLDVLTLVDTSTGSDASIAQRRVFLVKHDGTYLTPSNSTSDFIVWPISATTINIGGILDKDYSLAIEVQWVSSSNALVQSLERVVALTGYANPIYWNLQDLTLPIQSVLTAKTISKIRARYAA